MKATISNVGSIEEGSPNSRRGPGYDGRPQLWPEQSSCLFVASEAERFTTRPSLNRLRGRKHAPIPALAVRAAPGFPLSQRCAGDRTLILHVFRHEDLNRDWAVFLVVVGVGRYSELRFRAGRGRRVVPCLGLFCAVPFASSRGSQNSSWPSRGRSGHTGIVTVEMLAHISVDPLIVHGQACLKGTRIPVSIVLDCLGDGMTIDEIVRQYPSLTAVDVRAAAAYGAALAREEVLPLAGDR